MTQGLGSERSPVARIPRVAVESDGRGVAGQTHVRRWPRTTRCNELAVIVMRDGEPEGRESLIAAVIFDVAGVARWAALNSGSFWRLRLSQFPCALGYGCRSGSTRVMKQRPLSGLEWTAPKSSAYSGRFMTIAVPANTPMLMPRFQRWKIAVRSLAWRIGDLLFLTINCGWALAMTAKWCRFSWSSTADNQTLDQTADRIQRCGGSWVRR